ncbi:MAG: S9 family peptidase [Gemmatimonadales bacterium]
MTSRPSPSPVPAPPAARRLPVTIEMHGERLTDDYAWLRDRDDPAVLAYLTDENRYAEGVLGPLAGLEDSLYHEMLGRIKQTDLSVPYLDDGYWYYSRTEEGQQYPTYCRKPGSLEAEEEVLLDLNVMAVGHSFMAVGAFAVSPGGRYLAYSTDPTGFREYTLHIKDLETGLPVIEPVFRVGSVVWDADATTFYYSLEDETTKRDYQLHRGSLAGGDHRLLFEEPDERFRVFVTRTRSRRFAVMYVASHFTSEAHLLDFTRPALGWRLMRARIQDQEYDLDHQGDRLLIRTNDRGDNFRVVSVPADDPTAEWTEVLAHRDDMMVEGIEGFARHWIVWERRGGLPGIRIIAPDQGGDRQVSFAEEVYDASPDFNRNWDATTFRYRYESFVTALSVYEHDLASDRSILLKRKEVLGEYDPTAYRSERLTVIAPDGTAIPVSVVHRRDAVGPLPTYLTGYGAYGIPYPVSFTSNRLSLLDRGVAFAVAHIRGGGEMGRSWHDRGRLAEKHNTFDDFIAVADHLAAAGRTTPDRLVIEGGSAGGLLIGAVLNQRPDLCGAALLEVPFVDVINTMRDATLPLTVGEYEEWGNPEVPEQYAWLRAYCPYTNLAARPYPAILVRTSLNDSQVMYWEPAKYVARLRTLKTDPNPLVMLTNLGAGHGGASGRYDRLREIAGDYAFVLWRLGLAQT